MVFLLPLCLFLLCRVYGDMEMAGKYIDLVELTWTSGRVYVSFFLFGDWMCVCVWFFGFWLDWISHPLEG